MIAALYVEKGGIYYGLRNVDPWCKRRDARRYDGPHPVIAHPPCARWCQLAPVNEKRWGTKIGDDDGCFAAALNVVQRFGGVLEHPAWSYAWPAFGLQQPTRGEWRQSLLDGAWVTEVSQSAYGHIARKATWLYLVGEPQKMDWSDPPVNAVVGAGVYTGHAAGKGRIYGRRASATPVLFRDALISLVDLSHVPENSDRPEMSAQH